MAEVKLNIVTKLVDDGLQQLEKGLGKLKGAAGAIGNVATGGAAALGATFVAGTAAAINFADETNAAVSNLSKQTGVSGKELEEYKEIATSIFAGPPPVGESIRDVTDALAQAANITDLEGEALRSATKDATQLAETFDKDINEVLRAADSLVRNKVAGSFDEAFDLIAKGFTEGGDRADDLLDTLNEYAQDFGSLGFTAQETFNVIENGLEAGIFNTDKIGDAINEAFINFRDPGKLDGISEILSGLSEIDDQSRIVADEIANNFDAFNDGSRNGAVALDVLLDSLSRIEDPITRNALGVEIFGSMWEDLGENAILALQSTDEQLSDLEDGVDNITGSMDELADKPQSIQELWESAWRNIQLAIEPLGQQFIPLISDALLDFIELIQRPEIQDLAMQLGTDLVDAARDVFDALGRISEALGIVDENASSTEASIGLLISTAQGIADIIDLFVEAVELASGLADQVSTIFDLLDQGAELDISFGDIASSFAGAAADQANLSIEPGSIVDTLFGGTFHEGGVVPGPRGADVPIIAQAGETILPVGASAGNNITINIQAPVFGVDDLDRKIEMAGNKLMRELGTRFN